jgi:hypothetical protein
MLPADEQQGSASNFLGTKEISSLDPDEIKASLNSLVDSTNLKNENYAYIKLTSSGYILKVVYRDGEWHFENVVSSLTSANPIKLGNLKQLFHRLAYPGDFFTVYNHNYIAYPFGGKPSWCPSKFIGTNWLGLLDLVPPKPVRENSYYEDLSGWVFRHNGDYDLWEPVKYLGKNPPSKHTTLAYTHFCNPAHVRSSRTVWKTVSKDYLHKQCSFRKLLILPPGDYEFCMKQLRGTGKVSATSLISSIGRGLPHSIRLDFDTNCFKQSDRVQFCINKPCCIEFTRLEVDEPQNSDIYIEFSIQKIC